MLKPLRILLVNVVMILVYEIFDFMMWSGVVTPRFQITSWSPFGMDMWICEEMFCGGGFMPNFTLGVFLISIIVNMIMLRKLQGEHEHVPKERL